MLRSAFVPASNSFFPLPFFYTPCSLRTFVASVLSFLITVSKNTSRIRQGASSKQRPWETGQKKRPPSRDTIELIHPYRPQYQAYFTFHIILYASFNVVNALLKVVSIINPVRVDPVTLSFIPAPPLCPSFIYPLFYNNHIC